MVTNHLIDRIIELLDNDITHLGIGTGTIPEVEDATLQNETHRKAVTNLVDGFTLICEGYWDENEANNINFSNAGLFGNSATDTLNTGELLAGGKINVNKNNTQSLTVSIEITVEAVNE